MVWGVRENGLDGIGGTALMVWGSGTALMVWGSGDSLDGMGGFGEQP